jgi:hypothetical protein
MVRKIKQVAMLKKKGSGLEKKGDSGLEKKGEVVWKRRVRG